jgi:hypothetical protein
MVTAIPACVDGDIPSNCQFGNLGRNALRGLVTFRHPIERQHRDADRQDYVLGFLVLPRSVRYTT